ncbi:Pvstp1 [Plasmodium coatneyi]|uniref:Pvstp1 n=1 Tax=Plasmodium coatneyi TaxID=208452 RepID=A0A1B1E2F5_9APIC|nr:Pvstp1 [Plasmodium coatneyi]ANQ09107.1 Pvstp1 [Plasmodium coatneyi]
MNNTLCKKLEYNISIIIRNRGADITEIEGRFGEYSEINGEPSVEAGDLAESGAGGAVPGVPVASPGVNSSDPQDAHITISQNQSGQTPSTLDNGSSQDTDPPSELPNSDSSGANSISASPLPILSTAPGVTATLYSPPAPNQNGTEVVKGIQHKNSSPSGGIIIQGGWNIWNVRDGVLTPYLPFIPVLIGSVTIGYLLTKYFGLFGRQKRRYKRMTQIPRPPLEEHRDGTDVTISYEPYEYILMREGKGHHLTHTTEIQQKEHVNRKTIIDIHLESVSECQNQNHESELMNKVDFLQIIVEELMRFKFMKEQSSGNNISDDSLRINVLSNTDSVGTGTEQLGMKQNFSLENFSFLENECSIRYWVNWIQQNMNVLVEIKTQPWFYDLRVSWNEYQRDSQQSLLNDDVSSMESHKKELWKEWVRKQRSLMEWNSQKDWFKHLFDSIEEVDPEMLDQQQLCKDSYKPNNRLTVKLWMLILALVFEECEREENVCDKEFYLNHLLQNVCGNMTVFL